MTSLSINATHTTTGGIDEIETQEEIGFNLLGYTVIASLKDVEVEQQTALAILKPLGLDQYLPALPGPMIVLRRAVHRWMQDLAKKDLGLDEDDKILQRDIVRSRGAEILALALVAESSDLVAWGLSYLVGLKVFYNTKTTQLSLTRDRNVGYVSYPVIPADVALLHQLQPHWDYYTQVHTTSDLSRMVQKILMGMNSANMRKEGGTYFVPYVKRDELQLLKNLVEGQLPAVPGKTNGSKLSALALIDKPKTRNQVAHLMHQSFLAEIATLEKKLQRFVGKTEQEWVTKKGEKKHGKVRESTIEDRLTEYKNMKKKIDLYKDILADRQEGLITSLDQLRITARSLVDTYTDALAEEALNTPEAEINQPELVGEQEPEDEEEKRAEENDTK